MYNNYEPKLQFILKEEEHIKAYIHPIRMSILRILAKERMTISGTAKKIKVHPANITHHFKLLEKSGLILLVEKLNNGKNLEKYYRAVAMSFIVESENEEKNKKALALSVLKNSITTAINSVKDEDTRVTSAFLTYARLNPDRTEEFVNRFQELVKEFGRHNDPEGETYVLNIGMYPSQIEYENLIQEEIQLRTKSKD